MKNSEKLSINQDEFLDVAQYLWGDLVSILTNNSNPQYECFSVIGNNFHNDYRACSEYRKKLRSPETINAFLYTLRKLDSEKVMDNILRSPKEGIFACRFICVALDDSLTLRNNWKECCSKAFNIEL